MIFGFLPQNLKTKGVAVAFSMAWQRAEIEDRDLDAPGQDAVMAQGSLAAFRGELHRCFSARRMRYSSWPTRCCVRTGR